MKTAHWTLARAALLALALLPAAAARAQSDFPDAVDDPLFRKLPAEPKLDEVPSGKWKGSMGIGVTLRRGGSHSEQGSLSSEAVRTLRDSRLTFNAIAVRSSENGERSNDTADAEFRGERNITDSTYGFAAVSGERDGSADLVLRNSLSSGVGLRWIEREALTLNLYSGLALSREAYRGNEKARGFELLFGSEVRWQISDNARLTHRLVAYPDSVGGGARYAMQADLSTRINSTFGLQLAALQKFREKVREDASRSDTVIFTGITASF